MRRIFLFISRTEVGFKQGGWRAHALQPCTSQWVLPPCTSQWVLHSCTCQCSCIPAQANGGCIPAQVIGCWTLSLWIWSTGESFRLQSDSKFGVADFDKAKLFFNIQGPENPGSAPSLGKGER